MADNSPGEHWGTHLILLLKMLGALTPHLVDQHKSSRRGCWSEESPGQKLRFRYFLALKFCWKWCCASLCADTLLVEWKDSGFINGKRRGWAKTQKMCFSVPSSTIHISWSNCLEEETISPNFLRPQWVKTGNPGWLAGASGGCQVPAARHHAKSTVVVPVACSKSWPWRCRGPSEQPWTAMEVPVWGEGLGLKGPVTCQKCGLLHHLVVIAVQLGGPPHCWGALSACIAPLRLPGPGLVRLWWDGDCAPHAAGQTCILHHAAHSFTHLQRGIVMLVCCR